MTLETDKEITTPWPSPWDDDEDSEKLPFVLAGPILRLLESGRIFIWLATSIQRNMNVCVYKKNKESKYDICLETDEEGVTIQVLGENLFVYLFEINGGEDKLKADTIYYYDLCDSTKTSVFESEELDSITYKSEKYPSFVLPSKITSLLHASCRKLHAPCSDAMVRADELIQQKISDADQRPAVMCMTGDQIYADDVAGPLFFRIRSLSKLIVGDREDIQIPKLPGPDLHNLPIYGRAGTMHKASLTSRHAHNHVATFGEYAALYLLTLNPKL